MTFRSVLLVGETTVAFRCRPGAALTFKFIIFSINKFVTAIYCLNLYVQLTLCCLYMSAIPIKYVYTNDTLIEYREDIYTTQLEGSPTKIR